MRISDWSSDVCASDLLPSPSGPPAQLACVRRHASQWLASAPPHPLPSQGREPKLAAAAAPTMAIDCRRCRSNTRSEEHTPELQSLMRISYVVICLKKKHQSTYTPHHTNLNSRA